MAATVLQPGDLPELVARLRRWMADRDTDAYLLEGSFERYGSEVERAASIARPLVQDAASAIFALVLAIERTPEYKRSHGSTD